MATGPPGHRAVFFMSPTPPGGPVAPTVLTSSSAAAGPVNSFDLKDNQKRWVVIGICLNRLLLPVLRDFVGQEIPKHYTFLKTAYGIDTQVYLHYLSKDGPFNLNYGSINNNKGLPKKRYDYKVNSAEDLAKLYLEPHMAKFAGFDNTCDLSAVLGILANSSVFHTRIQTNAKDVRSKVRNEWGHCNFDHWTDVEFANCFKLMETMVRSLGLPKPDEDKQLDDLHDWETKGLELCMGCPVDKDVVKLISVEVANLEKEVENIKGTNADEAKKIGDALQTVKDEIEEFNKRIADIERKLDEERRERLEKEKELAGAIGDISSDVEKLDKRQDASEANISMLEIKQGNLETTVSSIKDEQHSLRSDVGALKIGQSLLDSRVKALEVSSLNSAARAKVVQLPSRNPYFCGRVRELDAIAAHLKKTENGCIHSAICGLGGVGKTSLAVEFLCRNEGEYPGGIFWISGEDNNLFQRSLSDTARQLGTFENDFSDSLSRTLDWLRRREELWCLVVDNLDELTMSSDMRKLLTGHWKHTARGHIIITTRREMTEIGEETGIEQQCCIELKCLTEDEGIQFLQMRTGRASGGESDMRKLVRELGGLPLALDQAAAYIRCLNQSVKEYVEKYKKQKLLLLKKKKARHLVDDTSPERLAVHTTWKLNFDHICHISKEMDLGGAPTLAMQVCAFLGPDDIPYELINEGLYECDYSLLDSLWDQAEIVSLLTKFSLFQRHGTSSFSVHRLVQEVIRSQLEKETESVNVLSCAAKVLHFALAHTLSPASVCESFVEDAVFSVENPPSLQLWGKLASHATYFQEHLSRFSANHKESVNTLLYRDETMRIFNEAGIFFSVSQEQVKAQEMQELKLDVLVKLNEKSASEDGTSLPHYFIDIPLKDRDYKLISHCMKQPPLLCDAMDETDSSQRKHEEETNWLRKQGNLAVQSKKYGEALELYSTAIGLSASDYRLFSNRALCYLKLAQPQNALGDCQKCLSLSPNYSKALQRKAWALRDLVKSGSGDLLGRQRATLAMTVHFDSRLLREPTFCDMFPGESFTYREIRNATQLAIALMTRRENETLLLREGQYDIEEILVFTDLQIVGLGQGVVLTGTKVCLISGACYFENVVFPKGEFAIICNDKKAAIHMNHCNISGGRASCEDYPECNGGPGCRAASQGKPVCSRTGKYGDPFSISGVGGHPALQISNGASALIEDCVIRGSGGGGALVAMEGSRLEVRKCEVFKNHQAGLEAREGGKLVAFENRIFDNHYHGVLLGLNSGECDINGNKIFENHREGIFALSNKNKIVIRNNDIHHNRPFGVSLDDDSHILISDNNIFENGFWGILAKSRTSANITGNIISGNKCGGIFIGVNFSGRIYLDSNIVRDHSGPWLEFQQMKSSLELDESVLSHDRMSDLMRLPHGEKSFYSKPPILGRNKEFNNKEGMCHPTEVVQRPYYYSSCTFCRRSGSEVQRFLKCRGCHIASYCCEECQAKHRSTHETLCIALKRRYSVTVKISPSRTGDFHLMRMFGTHLKGLGTGPKPKRNSCKEFIVKIQTENLNSHPLQSLIAYDKSLTIDCRLPESPEIFNVIMECGVLGALNKFTSKKAFFYAMFAENGEKLTVFLDHLAPYQEW